jgi:hypothetical protein
MSVGFTRKFHDQLTILGFVLTCQAELRLYLSAEEDLRTNAILVVYSLVMRRG